MPEPFDENEDYYGQDLKSYLIQIEEEKENAKSARFLVWLFVALLGLIFTSIFLSFLAA
jgi:FtsH-binding integral membrane protein